MQNITMLLAFLYISKSFN